MSFVVPSDTVGARAGSLERKWEIIDNNVILFIETRWVCCGVGYLK